MTTITVGPHGVRVQFTGVERVLGLVRDLEIPLSAVRSVAVAEDGLSAASGMRAPGLAWPGMRKLGTWRGGGHKTLVSVRRGQPALRLSLSGKRFTDVLLGSDQAQAYADRLALLGAGKS